MEHIELPEYGVTETVTTDRDGLDVATGGMGTSVIDRNGLSVATGSIDTSVTDRDGLSEATGGGSLENSMKSFALKDLKQHLGIGDDIIFDPNDFVYDSGTGSLRYNNGKEWVDLTDKRTSRFKRLFKTPKQIKKLILVKGQVMLGFNIEPVKNLLKELNKPVGDFKSENIKTEVIQMQEITTKKISDTESLISETNNDEEKQKLHEEIAVLREALEVQTQMERELTGYKNKLDLIDGQIKLATAERYDISRQIKHKEEKLKQVSRNELESNMSLEAIDQRIADLQSEYDARTDQIKALTAKQKSQVAQIKESVHKFLNKESGTLRERIAALFREQGVTLFSIVTAIGMTIGMFVEALLPGSVATTAIGGGGGSSQPGAKEWVKKKLETLKNLLKKLANKVGAALPGILGSIVSWVFNTLSKVVGAVAQNLWTLFLAAAYLIYDVYRRS